MDWNHRLSYLLGKILKPLKLSCNAMSGHLKNDLENSTASKMYISSSTFQGR